jgi:hypothetical protein
MDGAILGYALAFMAGVFFGASDTLVRAASVRLTPLQNLLVSLLVGTPILWSVALAMGSSVPSGRALLLYILAGLLNFILGRLLSTLQYHTLEPRPRPLLRVPPQPWLP